MTHKEVRIREGKKRKKARIEKGKRLKFLEEKKEKEK